jgi:thymidine phosphorylase
LARSLVEVANGAGVRTAALLTDMNQPLADAAGNAVEIVNCLDFLAGLKAGTRLEAVVLAQAAEMLVQAGVASNLAQAEERARMALSSGEAMERFARMVHALGGPADFCERPDAYLQRAPVRLRVSAPRDGYLAACETRDIGLAVVELGGGRKRAADPIDHRVGISELLPLGTQVSKGEPIAIVHAKTGEDAERIARDIARFYTIADAPVAAAPVILKRIG